MRLLIGFVCAVSALAAFPAFAGDKAGGAEYGKVQKCVSLRQIERTEVVDDQTILFHMMGGRIYENKLPNRCPSLGFEKRFSYRLSQSRLCNVDIITVLYSSPPRPGASCGLGDFVSVDPAKLKAEKEAEKAAEQAAKPKP